MSQSYCAFRREIVQTLLNQKIPVTNQDWIYSMLIPLDNHDCVFYAVVRLYCYYGSSEIYGQI